MKVTASKARVDQWVVNLSHGKYWGQITACDMSCTSVRY